MWLRNGERKTIALSGLTTLIAEASEVHGDIRFRGNLDVEVVVHGNIMTEAGQEAAVRVL